MEIRTFIGISNSKISTRYAVSLYINGEYYPLDAKQAPKSWSNHKVTLVAIRDVLKELAETKKEINVIYYSNDDLIAFEWEVQYKQDKFFTEKVEDVDIFKEIIKIIENNKISLTIYGNNTILEKMNIKERKRARRL